MQLYSVLAHVTVQSQHVDEFIALNREFFGASVREEPGTLSFDVIQDETAPNHFYTHETYVDAAAFQAHMQGEVIKRYGPRIVPLLIGIIDDSIFLGKGFNITLGDRAYEADGVAG
jgi:autoinducer 2-degrading protein